MHHSRSPIVDVEKQRWFLKLICLLLTAALLVTAVSIYYAYKVKQLENKGAAIVEAASNTGVELNQQIPIKHKRMTGSTL
ncbi:hypothetical protein [Rudanella lutea]|jgi:hypothetical protein|uniref:hypothetical protein n=1 Tax=Rudanella lutea TaxID=451374 RepID=UPI00037E3A2A|nr:hypothetical protein [Rudanella lutea]